MKKIYPIKKDNIKEAIRSNKDCCLWFYGGLYLTTNFMSTNKNGVLLDKYGNNENKFEINNQENNFTVQELYVYEVTFI